MKIALLGDIALIGRYDKTITPDAEKRIEAVYNLVRDCDCVMANLESPLTSKTHTICCKGVYLRSDPVNVDLLKQMGITHVTLANNHIYDYGKFGANETIQTLGKAGIKYVGLNNQPEIVKQGKNAIAINGFCCLSANALNYGEKIGQVKMLSYDNMEAFFKFSKNNNCLPIASVHFGLEGLHYPSIEHMNLFRSLANKYNYILHGNHPHAIQGFETYNSSLLIYAQGNLCFDETPITSIHFVPEEKPDERKCYISIVEVEDNKIISHEALGLTDLESNILHRDHEVEDQLVDYSKALCETLKEIEARRQEEKDAQRIFAQKRNIHFYLDRMNYKYIGAYLNGRNHAKQYTDVFAPFMNVEEQE